MECFRGSIGGLGNDGWTIAGCIFWSTATGSTSNRFVAAETSLFMYSNLIEGGNGSISAGSGGGTPSTLQNTITATSASNIFESTDPTNANYLRLKAGSPAIDTARGEFTTFKDAPFSFSFLLDKRDAAGNPRYVPGGLDLGGYEYQTSIFPLSITTNPSDINNLLASNGEVVASIDIGAGVTRWRASTDNSFLTLMPATGMADGDLTIRYTTNASSAERIGGVQINAENASGNVVGSVDIKLRQSSVSLSIHELEVTTDPPSPLSVPATMGQVTATIDIGGSAEGWRATTTSDFLTLMPSSGMGDGSLMIRYTANTGAASRMGEVSIATTGTAGNAVTSTLRLTQLGMGEIMLTVTTDPTSLSTLPSSMGSVTASINILGTVTGWRATTTSSLLTIMPTSGMGNTGTFTIAYSANTNSEPRALGDVVVTTMGGEGMPESTTLRLNQVAAPTSAGIALIRFSGPAIDNIPQAGGTIVYNVSLSGSATGWTASTESPPAFLSISPMESTASAQVAILVRRNSGARRQGTITFTTRGGRGTATANLMITQLGTDGAQAHTLAVTTTPTTLGALPATLGQVRASIDIGGGASGWRATTTSGFLNLSRPLGTEDGTLTISYGANSSNTSRTGEVVISTTGTGTAITNTLRLTQLGEGVMSFGVAEGVFSTIRVVNPVSNDLVIYGLPVVTTFRLSSLVGRLIFSTTLPAGQQRVSIPPLERGIYYISLRSKEGEEHLLRILKE